MKAFTLFFSLILLSACGQIKHFYKPAINETITKEVGETLITDGWGVEYDCSTVKIENEFIAEKELYWGGRYSINIPADTIFVKNTGAYNVYRDYYYVTKTPLSISEYSKDGKLKKSFNTTVGVFIPKTGDIYITPPVFNINLTPQGGNSAVVYKLTLDKCYDDTHAQQYFKRELLYNGVSGNVITIKYREFTNDLARPSFTQDLTYDLGKSVTIGFKGARIRVLEANNVSIKYTVLKYFE